MKFSVLRRPGEGGKAASLQQSMELGHAVAAQQKHRGHVEAGGMVIYVKMLDRGTFGMPIPGSKDVVTSSIKWEVLIYL